MNVGSTVVRLVVLAATCVLIGAVKIGEPILVPITYAALAAALLNAPVAALRRRRVPQGLAVVGVVSLAMAWFVVLLSFVGGAVQGFLADLPRYRRALDQQWLDLVSWVEAQGIDMETVLDDGLISPGAVLSSIGGVLNSVVGLASNLVMIMLLAGFLLLESEGMVDRVRQAFRDPEMSKALLGTGRSLQTYLGVKTLTSAFTGLLIWIALRIMGVDHAELWGFLAFLLNFIPTIGSIVAAVPPVLLAIVLGGPFEAVMVAGLFFGVNTIVGNVLEPRVMGDQLGLSAFVVLLALFSWGWLWGVNGMLLSVPLTVLLKEVFASQEDTRWLAALMGPGGPVIPQAVAAPDAPDALGGADAQGAVVEGSGS